MQIVLALIACALAGAGLYHFAKGRGTRAAGKAGSTPVAVVTEHTALVTTPISPEAAGGITYSVAGRRRDITARSVDGTPIKAGTMVAIDRIEGAMAFVCIIP